MPVQHSSTSCFLLKQQAIYSAGSVIRNTCHRLICKLSEVVLKYLNDISLSICNISCWDSECDDRPREVNPHRESRAKSQAHLKRRRQRAETTKEKQTQHYSCHNIHYITSKIPPTRLEWHVLAVDTLNHSLQLKSTLTLTLRRRP